MCSTRNWWHLQDMFWDDFKVQRSIIISFITLLVLYMAVDEALKVARYGRVLPNWLPLGRVLALALVGLAVVAYRPIDLQRSVFAADLSQFRAGLSNSQSLCVPIPPNPGWGDGYLNMPAGNWWYQNRGGCFGLNYEHQQTIQAQAISGGFPLTVPSNPAQQIKSLLVPVYNPRPAISRPMLIQDLDDGRIYPANIPAKTNNEALSFLSFNLHGAPARSEYHFLLLERGNAASAVRIAKFTSDAPAFYALFMGYPNLAERTP